jgi:hypothetical protein
LFKLIVGPIPIPLAGITIGNKMAPVTDRVVRNLAPSAVGALVELLEVINGPVVAQQRGNALGINLRHITTNKPTILSVLFSDVEDTVVARRSARPFVVVSLKQPFVDSQEGELPAALATNSTLVSDALALIGSFKAVQARHIWFFPLDVERSS